MFGRGDAFYQHKIPTPVRLEISGAEPIEGFVFLAVGDRLSDLLNDARLFIPVRRADGHIVIVAKQHIVSLVECAAAAQKAALPNKTDATPEGAQRKSPRRAARRNTPHRDFIRL